MPGWGIMMEKNEICSRVDAESLRASLSTSGKNTCINLIIDREIVGLDFLKWNSPKID